METVATPREKIEAYIAKHGLTMHCEFVPYSRSRADAKSLNWIVTIRKNGKDVLKTDFTAGAAHAPSYKPRMTVFEAARFEYEIEHGKAANGKKPLLPDFCNILYSLAMNSDAIEYTFEEWASNLGADPDSRKAEAAYRACLDATIRLRSAGLPIEELREACEGY